MRSPVDSSSFRSSATLPFSDKLSNTLGLASGQTDQDRKDGRAIQNVQGSVSAARTAPCKGSVRGRGTYGSSASRDLGTVAEISPFCECLNFFCAFCVFVCFQVYDAAASGIVKMDVPFRMCRVRFLRRGRRPARAACEGGAPTAPPPPATSGRSLRSLHFANV